MQLHCASAAFLLFNLVFTIAIEPNAVTVFQRRLIRQELGKSVQSKTHTLGLLLAVFDQPLYVCSLNSDDSWPLQQIRDEPAQMHLSEVVVIDCGGGPREFASVSQADMFEESTAPKIASPRSQSAWIAQYFDSFQYARLLCCALTLHRTLFSEADEQELLVSSPNAFAFGFLLGGLPEASACSVRFNEHLSSPRSIALCDRQRKVLRCSPFS